MNSLFSERMPLFVRSLIFLLVMAISGAALKAMASQEKAVVTKPAEIKAKKLMQNRKTKIDRPFNIESYDWEGAIPESRLVIVKNHYGSIRSRNHSDEKVFIHATYQEIGKSPLRPEFKIEEKAGRLEIEVSYDGNLRDASGNLRGRTDIAVLFPDTVSIYAETDSGLIKIDKTASNVEAVSKSGTINLTTTGLFAATSDSGPIKLRLRGTKQAGTAKVSSKSGAIKVSVFNDMDINIKAETQGALSLNGKVLKNGQLYQHGNGAADVRIHSVSGKVEVDVIAPPELVKSVKPSAVAVNVDLRDLPKAKSWQPGDPIYDRDDKKDYRKKNTKTKKLPSE